MAERSYEIKDFALEGEEARKTVFYSTEATSGSIWVIKPGQTLKKHIHPQGDDIWIILEGEGIFYPEEGKEVPFHAGQVIVNPKNSCHGAYNNSDKDIVFASIVGPVPVGYEAL